MRAVASCLKQAMGKGFCIGLFGTTAVLLLETVPSFV